MSHKYESLQRIIQQRQAESHRMNDALHRVSGLERHALRLEKRSFGKETRSILLAYAMLRGRPYATVERTCVHAPSASAIADVVQMHAAIEDTVQEVKRWLTSSSS